MIKSITAIERDGLSIRTLSMNFEILKPEVNLRDAVREASTEYCNTVDGRKVYDYNCNSFNWADFWDNVPNAICEKYGFRKQDNIISAEDVDWDEHLVDDEMLTLTDEQWEELKKELFVQGREALENFLGFELPQDYDKDTVDNQLDGVMSQMSGHTLKTHYDTIINNYCYKPE